MSPLIHSFELSGTAYVKSLFDKDEVRRQINNSVYSWLDLNADFNVGIQKSNITQIIEDNSAIVRVDYDIVPTGVPKAFGTSLMNDMGASGISNIVYTVFGNWINGGGIYASSLSATEEQFFNVLMKEFDQSLLSGVNDYTLGTSDILFAYASPVTVNGTEYVIDSKTAIDEYYQATSMYPDYSGYLLRVLSMVRESMSYYIKLNLINRQYGNIGIPDDEGYGKYSLGSEIPKIDCSKLNYVYKK